MHYDVQCCTMMYNRQHRQPRHHRHLRNQAPSPHSAATPLAPPAQSIQSPQALGRPIPLPICGAADEFLLLEVILFRD